MSEKSPPGSPSPEASRVDAQRQAFSTLLSRFTADRDALVASVQKCEEQMAEIAARLDGAPLPTSAGGASRDDVRDVVSELRDEQREALDRLHAAVDQATLRADLALRSIEEMGGTVAPGVNGDDLATLRATVERLASEWDSRALQPETAAAEESLADLASRVSAVETLLAAEAPAANVHEEVRALRTAVDHLGTEWARRERDIEGLLPVNPAMIREVAVDLEARISQLEERGAAAAAAVMPADDGAPAEEVRALRAAFDDLAAGCRQREATFEQRVADGGALEALVRDFDARLTRVESAAAALEGADRASDPAALRLAVDRVAAEAERRDQELEARFAALSPLAPTSPAIDSRLTAVEERLATWAAPVATPDAADPAVQDLYGAIVGDLRRHIMALETTMVTGPRLPGLVLSLATSALLVGLVVAVFMP